MVHMSAAGTGRRDCMMQHYYTYKLSHQIADERNLHVNYACIHRAPKFPDTTINKPCLSESEVTQLLIGWL